MFDLGDPKTFWLTITNIGLGVVTLAALLAIGWGVVWELVARKRQRAHSAALADDHAFRVPGLGITMADGGEKLDETRKN